MKLTENFSLREFEVSQTAARGGYSNRIPEELIENIEVVAYWLQDLRDRLGEECEENIPLSISSGYRGDRLNREIRGSKNSAHVKALAADFTSNTLGAPSVFNFILRQRNMRFDQCILEFDKWVHIGFKRNRAQERNQILIATKKSNWRGKMVTHYEAIKRPL